MSILDQIKNTSAYVYLADLRCSTKTEFMPVFINAVEGDVDAINKIADLLEPSGIPPFNAGRVVKSFMMINNSTRQFLNLCAHEAFLVHQFTNVLISFIKQKDKPETYEKILSWGF